MKEMKDKLAEFEFKTQQGSTDGNEFKDMGEQMVSLFSSEENDVALVKQKGEWVAFTPEISLASCNARESDNSEHSSTVSDTQADKDPHSAFPHVILPVERGYSPILLLNEDESCRKVLIYRCVC